MKINKFKKIIIWYSICILGGVFSYLGYEATFSINTVTGDNSAIVTGNNSTINYDK